MQYHFDEVEPLLGGCKTNSSLDTYRYTISINEELVKNGSDFEIAKTVAHEYLHTVPGGYGHKGEWKKWANFVNKFTDYNITRTSGEGEKGVELHSREGNRYEVVCNECGTGYKYKRMCKVVRTAATKTGTIHCGHCGLTSTNYTVKYL